jgi:hypothetical protein
MIIPTIGRVILYHPGERFSGVVHGKDPVPALITCVWSDTCINIGGFDANGNAFGATSVLLVQEGNPVPDTSYASWMPYQVAVAAGTVQPVLHALPVEDEPEVVSVEAVKPIEPVMPVEHRVEPRRVFAPPPVQKKGSSRR